MPIWLHPMAMPDKPTVAMAENCQITVISQAELTATAVTVVGMDMDLQRRLPWVDQFHAFALQLLASVMVLPHWAVTLIQCGGP